MYEAPAPADGLRVLVDRLWPRGLSKGDAGVDHWVRDVAPSDDLRRWFGHDPAKWDAFLERYAAELDAGPEAVEALCSVLAGAGRRPVTLLYAARDELHNNAVALRRYLEGARRPRRPG